MLSKMLQKARANRIAALNSLARGNASNIFLLEDARSRRQPTAVEIPSFISCRGHQPAQVKAHIRLVA